MARRRLSSAEVSALLSSAEGGLLVSSVQHQVALEAAKNRLVARALARYDVMAGRIRRAVQGRHARLAGDQRQSFARSSEFTAIKVRTREILTSGQREIRDVVQDGLTAITRRSGMASTKVRGALVRGLTPRAHFSNAAAFTWRDINSSVSLSLSGDQPLDLEKALRKGRRNIETVTRLTATHVTARSREGHLAGSGFRLTRYIAILDGHQTDRCDSLAGRVYEIYKGPRPPQHWGCRSFMMPATSRSRLLGCITPGQFEEFTGTRIARQAA